MSNDEASPGVICPVLVLPITRKTGISWSKSRDFFFFCPETKMMRVTGLSLLLGKTQEAGPVQLGEKKA